MIRLRNSFLVALLGLVLAYLWGGTEALFFTIFLIVLEVSLSFDNAVVNARILSEMDAVWQKRFLTWGMFFAVFVVRFLLPILIVALATSASLTQVFHTALFETETYAKLLAEAHLGITAFGGTFLLMVFLKFFFDESKEVHWITAVESRLAAFGKLESAEVSITLVCLLAISQWVTNQGVFLVAGIIGLLTYIASQTITEIFSGAGTAKVFASSGLALFAYLQVIDASFSLDGVVGAFAISQDIVVIALGLSVGAFFVRSLTILLVEKKTLDEYIYLEHGAHYAIGALASLMLASSFIEIPNIVTGLVGGILLALSLLSSHLERVKLA